MSSGSIPSAESGGYYEANCWYEGAQESWTNGNNYIDAADARGLAEMVLYAYWETRGEPGRIGSERPESEILRGIYTGSRPELRGKTAFISRYEGGWIVQVDDLTSDFCYDWWKFPHEDWSEK